MLFSLLVLFSSSQLILISDQAAPFAWQRKKQILNGWWYRFHVLIYLFALSIPATLIMTSLIGYHYTSLRLIQEFRPTFILLFVLCVSVQRSASLVNADSIRQPAAGKSIIFGKRSRST